ncbi:hypothetical protein Leryth_016246 [Lithospermum erythrorhizon]|nr:hypothetical protein Leryth_016246 [Lithospermum erythrorhizon]
MKYKYREPRPKRQKNCDAVYSKSSLLCCSVLHHALSQDKRKQLEKSNDVDGSSNTTEDTIIPRKGEHYDVSAIRAELHGKVFLMLLRRTFGKQNESQRKMLLVSFHEVTDTAESTSSMVDDENTRAANKIPYRKSDLHL